jgi:hypothetical protein
MHDPALAVHIVAGVIGLLSGPVLFPALIRGEPTAALTVYQLAAPSSR